MSKRWELFRAAPPNCLLRFGCGGEARDCRGEGVGISRLYEKPVFTVRYDLGYPADIRGDDGKPHRLGVDERCSQPLVGRGEGENIEDFEEISHVIPKPDEDETPPEAERSGKFSNFFPFWPVPDCHKRNALEPIDDDARSAHKVRVILELDQRRDGPDDGMILREYLIFSSILAAGKGFQIA